MKVTCELCPHHCAMEDGQTGFCRARKNSAGTIVCANYGKLTSLALDPIEKKPFQRFHPGAWVLSVGSFGCNLRCPFCQNCEISMAGDGQMDPVYVSPEALVEKALECKRQGNIGIAFTYNEPLVGYEYVRDCAVLAHQQGLQNVLVTNGMICEDPLTGLLPYIDAMNIDLKGFTQDFYAKVRGDLDTVKQTIRLSAQHCHVEVTTLIVPGENDGASGMRELSKWLASVDKTIPLHITRFFPRYHMTDRPPTPVKTVYQLAQIARENLKYVYEGNC